MIPIVELRGAIPLGIAMGLKPIYVYIVCIIGSSGSGKSTLLRCINLLEKPSGGQIIYNGENILDDNHDICQYRTKLGMVFQQFNLFNNHNVLSNCVVGQMKVLGRSREEAEKLL